MAQRVGRVHRDLRELEGKNQTGFNLLGPIDDINADSIFKVSFFGPPASPFEGKHYVVQISLPARYTNLDKFNLFDFPLNHQMSPS